MKKMLLVFTSAFILNVIWENLHSFLYASYKGGAITEYILLRASLFDALIITSIVVPFLFITSLPRSGWLIFIIGTAVAITNEYYGLGTGRWAYNSLMPIVPLIKVGITPAMQLGLLGYLTYFLVKPCILTRLQQKWYNIDR